MLNNLFATLDYQQIHKDFYSLESYAMQDLRANIARETKPKILTLFKFDLNSADQINKINSYIEYSHEYV